jgi:hypothetical protein
VNSNLGAYFPARRRYDGGRSLPTQDAFAALNFPFKQVDSGSQDVNFALHPKPQLEALDAALVLFLDHQGFAHINFRTYAKAFNAFIQRRRKASAATPMPTSSA